MKNKISNLVRSEIITMQAYKAARSKKKSGRIWLDANENPWEDTIYNRYPEQQPSLLLMRLSVLYAVKNEEILITRGSDEGIDLLIRLFCRANIDKIIICPPTYGMYQVAAQIQNAKIIEVPLQKNQEFSLDLLAIEKNLQKNIKMIFLCSPNNPTGNLLNINDILYLCKKLSEQAVIVVDEAYIEFANTKSLINCINLYPNLIILRTLSKAYGLAGIRCGATIANKEIINLLKKIIAPYPIAVPISQIVCKKISTDISKKIDMIIKEREKLFLFFQSLDFVKKIWPSQANFLLMEVINRHQILSACLAKGIVLRDRHHDYGLENCIRITIGKSTENTRLKEVLNNV